MLSEQSAIVNHLVNIQWYNLYWVLHSTSKCNKAHSYARHAGSNHMLGIFDCWLCLNAAVGL